MPIVHMYIWKIIKVIIRNGNGKILNPELAQNSVLGMLSLLAYFEVSPEELLYLISLAPGVPKLGCTFALSGEVRVLPSAQGGSSVKERGKYLEPLSCEGVTLSKICSTSTW